MAGNKIISGWLVRTLKADDLPFILGDQQCFGIILIYQNLIVCIGYLNSNSLKGAVPHRKEILGRISMVILATPYPWDEIRVRLAQSSNVNKQSSLNIDPSGIDDVLAIPSTSFGRAWVDVEQIVTLFGLIFGDIMEDGSTQMLAKVLQRGTRHLDIEVPIPVQGWGVSRDNWCKLDFLGLVPTKGASAARQSK